jgi:hypothetical protein
MGGDGSAVQAVIEAERAFSARSVQDGMREAFLTYFADSVVTFGPLPVRGTEALRSGPPGPTLEWWPEVAEVSGDGTMGYTAGPYRVPLADGAAAWGHYYSVWALLDDGWRVVLDIGGPHGPVPVPADVRVPDASAPRGSGPARADGGTGEGRAAGTPLDRDRSYAAAYRAADGGDLGDVVRRFRSPRAQVYRPGLPPREAPEIPFEGGAHGTLESWEPLGGSMAASADLGYTWGRGTLRREGSVIPVGYARFWRRPPGGTWRFVVEVVLAGG